MQDIKTKISLSLSSILHFSTITSIYLYLVFWGFSTEFGKASYIFSNKIQISQSALNNNNIIKIYFENLLKRCGLFFNTRLIEGSGEQSEPERLSYLSNSHYIIMYVELISFHFLFIAFFISSFRTFYTNPGVLFYVRHFNHLFSVWV